METVTWHLPKSQSWLVLTLVMVLSTRAVILHIVFKTNTMLIINKKKTVGKMTSQLVKLLAPSIFSYVMICWKVDRNP